MENLSKNPLKTIFLVAERAGFEPAKGVAPLHAFQACAFNHSATSPYFY